MRPLPQLTPENEFFWTCGEDGVLRMQSCVACDRLNHDGLCTLYNPNQRVWCFQNMATGQTRCFESLKPVSGNGVERSALTRNTIKAALRTPHTLKGGQTITNDHDRKFRSLRNGILPLSN